MDVEWGDDELADIKAEPEPPKPKRSANLDDCPDCGNMVSKSAYSCPHCGRPLRGKAVECYLTISRDYEQGYRSPPNACPLTQQVVLRTDLPGENALPTPHCTQHLLVCCVRGGYVVLMNRCF